jgi:hypothetical protein
LTLSRAANTPRKLHRKSVAMAKKATARGAKSRCSVGKRQPGDWGDRADGGGRVIVGVSDLRPREGGNIAPVMTIATNFWF